MSDDLLLLADEAGCTPLQVETLRLLMELDTVAAVARHRRVSRFAVRQTRNAAIRNIRTMIEGSPIPMPQRSRQEMIVDMRRAGHSWRYIARGLGIDTKTARDLYDRAPSR